MRSTRPSHDHAVDTGRAGVESARGWRCGEPYHHSRVSPRLTGVHDLRDIAIVMDLDARQRERVPGFQFLIGRCRVGRTIGTRTSTRRPPGTKPSVIALPMWTSEISRSSTDASPTLVPLAEPMVSPGSRLALALERLLTVAI